MRLEDLSIFEQAVLALSIILIGFLLIDPFVLERSKALMPSATEFFRQVTDIGTSAWILIPTGAAIAIALVLRRFHLGFRNAAGYGLMASTIGFVFVSVGGAGLIANMIKNILGRARPKLFDSGGPLDFHLFAFDADYASFPSGHATNIFAFATVIGILWPRARVLLYTGAAWVAATRFLIGAHYFMDAVGGAMLGTAFPFLVRARFAARRWLFEPAPGGGYRLRAPRTQRWLGWPEASGSDRKPPEARLFGNSGRESQGNSRD